MRKVKTYICLDSSNKVSMMTFLHIFKISGWMLIFTQGYLKTQFWSMVKAFALFISLTMINITQLRQYFLSLALLQFLHVCAIPSGLNRNLSNLNSTGHIDSLIVNGERSVDRSFFVKVITLEVATVRCNVDIRLVQSLFVLLQQRG